MKFQVAVNFGLVSQEKPSHRALRAPISNACTVVGKVVGVLVGAGEGATVG